ncbi:MAG TPA: MFS transporter [Planctomycetota bacterium]|nr:MFS transporter [Planctomycetota bacterium]
MFSFALALRKKAEQRFSPAGVNFWCHVSEGAFASFGFSLVSGGFIFPVIATQLGASPFMLGAFNSVMGLSFLAQLLFAHRMESVHRKKHLVLMLGIGQRAPFLAIPLCLLALATNAPLVCLILITAVNLAAGFLVSLLVPPWMDLVAETIPKERVGRLFGYRNSISSAMSLVSGMISYALIAGYAFPTNYALVYFLSLGSVMISWLLFTLVDEAPQDAPVRHRQSAREYHGELLATLKRDQAYRCYLAYKGISRIGFAAMFYYSVVAISPKYGVSPAFAAGVYATIAAGVQIVGNLLFPLLGERFGHKRLLMIGAVLHAAAALTAAYAPSGGWFIAVVVLSSMGVAAQAVGESPLMLQVAPRSKRIGYMVLSSVVLAPVGMVASPVAGYLLQEAGATTLFGLAAAGILAALIPLERCRPAPEDALAEGEPVPAAPSREAAG